MRWYVARLKAAAAPKEVYVHRSPRPGVTLEVDFGESWAEVAGVLRKVKYVVATLPYSNVYFAKAYPIERLESLLDGIQAALAYMGGVTDRVVLDNTTIAVKQVLTGRDRVQTDAFQAFRGAYPFAAAFCAPAKGWEKGSVETGVKYVRNLVFRPRPTVANWTALNALIITELEADVATRRLADGRPVREAWTLERRHLRARPVHLPETCRVEARVVDKFGHVRADRVTYSVPTRYAYRPVWVKLYHDRVAVAAGTEGRRQTRPGVSRRGDGARSAPRAAGAGTQAPRRPRGDGSAELAAGAAVAAGPDRSPAADAQAGSGLGPDAAAAGNLSRPGRRGGGRGRPRPQLAPARNRAPAVAPTGGWPPARDPHPTARRPQHSPSGSESVGRGAGCPNWARPDLWEPREGNLPGPPGCRTFGPEYARTLRRRQGRLGDTWYLDELFVKIQGRRRYLWRAVDQAGDLLDSLVQSRRDRRAATRFFRKLLKAQGRAPRRLITDKLRSYSAAHRTVMPSVVHSTRQYENNRAEVSHQSTRQRERQMRRFRSAAHA